MTEQQIPFLRWLGMWWDFLAYLFRMLRLGFALAAVVWVAWVLLFVDGPEPVYSYTPMPAEVTLVEQGMSWS